MHKRHTFEYLCSISSMAFSMSFILCSSFTASSCFFSACLSDSLRAAQICKILCCHVQRRFTPLRLPELCGTSADWAFWLAPAGAVRPPACPVSRGSPSPAASWPPPSPASSPPGAPAHAAAPNRRLVWVFCLLWDITQKRIPVLKKKKKLKLNMKPH